MSFFEVKPGVLRDALAAQNKELSELRNRISALLSDIEAYVNDTRLQGRAYTAHKKYKSEGHGDYLRKLRQALFAHEEANNRHMRALETYLSPYEWLHKDQIQDEVDDWTRELNWLNGWLSNVSVFSAELAATLWVNTRKVLENLIAIGHKKLQQIADFEAATNGLYDEADQLLTEANRLLVRIEHSERCLTTGSVTMPAMSKVDDIVAVNEILDSLFFESGKLDVGAVSDLLGKYLENGTGLHYRALVALHLDSRISSQDIVDIHATIAGRWPWPPDAIDFEMIRTHQELVQKLTADISGSFFSKHDRYLRGCTLVSEDELKAKLLRSQLLTFIGAFNTDEWSIFAATRIDLRDFPPQPGSDSVQPRLVFYGKTYYATSFEDFNDSRTFLAERYGQTVLDNFDAQTANMDWGRLALPLSEVPAAVLGAFVDKYGIVGAANALARAYKEIRDEAERISKIDEVQARFIRHMEAIGIAELGGGVAGMETTRGFEVIGTNTSTNQALINSAALERMGISIQDAALSLSNETVPGYAIIRNFVDGEKCNVREETLNALIETGNALYRESTLTNNSDPYRLPVMDLELVIEHWRRQQG